MKEQNLKFKSVVHMANELPYFEVDEGGIPRLAMDLGYGIIDCHAHLAHNYLFAKAIDYWRSSDYSNTFLSVVGMPVDLSQYSGVDMSRNDPLNHLKYIQTLFTSRVGLMPHHTATNLLREMDRSGVSHAINLAIDMPFISRNSRQMLDVFEKADRLIPFVSVHPAEPGWRSKLKHFVERGARGLKIHPEIQLLAIDNDKWKPVLDACGEMGLHVLCHTSVSPVEPGFVSGKKHVARSQMYRFEKVLDRHGDVTFFMGHGGMLEYEVLIELAGKYANCVCEIDGQPPHHLEKFFEHVDSDRIVAGSDWPVYPLVFQFAKPLIATEGMPELRWKVLHANAARILGLPVTPCPAPDSVHPV